MILGKTVDDSKRYWNLEFLVVLWTYQMSYNATTHTIQFILVYEIERVFLIEFKVLTLRITMDEMLLVSKSIEYRSIFLEKLN